MRRQALMLVLCTCCLIPNNGWSGSYSIDLDEENINAPLRGTIEFSQDLSDPGLSSEMVPAEMYGTWQRTRHLVSSNFPARFEVFEKGYWVIEKNQNQLTLTNPENGANTTIQVQSVKGKTASFRYKSKMADGSPCMEELVLVAGSSSLKGTQEKVCSSSHGKIIYSALAQVAASRVIPGEDVSIFW